MIYLQIYLVFAVIYFIRLLASFGGISQILLKLLVSVFWPISVVVEIKDYFKLRNVK